MRLLLSTLFLGMLLTGCMQQTNSNVANTNGANTNTNTATGTTMPPASGSLLEEIAAVMDATPQERRPVSFAWPVGEGNHQYTIPASGMQFTFVRTAPLGLLRSDVVDELHMGYGPTISGAALTETVAIHRLPEACLWTAPTEERQNQLGTYTLTVACGVLDESRIIKNPKTLPETEAFFTQLARELNAGHGPAKDAYMQWYDKTVFEKQSIVKGREVFFPRIEKGVVAWDAFERLGFERTTYTSDGTVTGAQGYQRGTLGCILVHSVRGWKEELAKPDVVAEGETVPFHEKQTDGTSEATVTCGIIQ